MILTRAHNVLDRGIVYCTNRSTAIYELIIERAEEDAAEKVSEAVGSEQEVAPNNVWISKATQRLSSPSISARSPRVIFPSASRSSTPEIIYLANALGGVHNSCGSLHSLTPLMKNVGYKHRILIDVVHQAEAKNDDAFHGLFVDGLLPSSILHFGGLSYVALSTFNRSRKVLLLVNLDDGSITSLTPWRIRSDDLVFPYLLEEQLEEGDDGLKSFALLATNGSNRIVAVRSSMMEVPVLVLGSLLVSDGVIGIEWSTLKQPKLTPKCKFLTTLSLVPLPTICLFVFATIV